MSLQPKNRKYRLSFRNKTQIYNNFPKDIRIRKLRNNLRFKTNISYKDQGHYENAKCSLYETQSTVFSRGLSVNMNPRVSQITLVKKVTQIFHNHTKNSMDMPFLPNSERQSMQLFNKKQLDSIITPSQKTLTTNLTSAVIGAYPKFGECGLYFCSSGTVSSKFIDTIRLTIARKLKKVGRFWIRVSPDTPVTARSAETRMGRGKGAISHYEAKVRPGQMFIEFSGVPQESVRQIYQQIIKKTSFSLALIV